MRVDPDRKVEVITIRLQEGTGERVYRVLKGGEVRSAFIRAAIKAELERREAAVSSDPESTRRYRGLD